MAHITFTTGNQNKADYLAKFLDISLHHRKIDLDEIQSLSLSEIVEHKVKQAYSIIKKPVLVEDTSLEFAALGTLPGPFIKFFIEQMPLENICEIIGGGSRAATARSAFGYYDGTTLQLIEGGMNGSIALKQAGSGGYGWDKIFIPEGFFKTQAQLSSKDYETNYVKIKELKKLREFLEIIKNES